MSGPLPRQAHPSGNSGEPQLGQVTLELYAMLWDVHILPRLGNFKLRDLTAEVIDHFRVDSKPQASGRSRSARRSPCFTGSCNARSSGTASP
jgi:hypothetical protein